MNKNSIKSKHIVRVPLCALFIFIGAVTAQAATYYVAKTGNNANTCAQAQSPSTPKLTINAGIACMGAGNLAAGNTVYVRAGTYTEQINSNSYAANSFPWGTSYANAPLISAYPGEMVTLNINDTAIALPHEYIQYVIFQGFIIDGLTTAQTNVVVGTGSTFPHHIRLLNLELKRAASVAFAMNGHFLEFTGGSIHDVGNDALWPPPLRHYGAYVNGSDNLIENATIYNIDHYGIHGSSSFTYGSNRNTYRNNIIHHTGLRADATGSAAIIFNNGAGGSAYNNILYSNQYGIQTGTSGTSSNILVYNNTIYSNAQYGIQVASFGTGTIVRNNIVYNNEAGTIWNLGSGTVSDHNLTTDPSFVNAAAFDFNLQTSSHAIDAGVILSSVTTDFKNNPRPQGSTYDIGAYEVSTTSDTTPPLSPRGLSVN